jgi:hypothetical protein
VHGLVAALRFVGSAATELTSRLLLSLQARSTGRSAGMLDFPQARLPVLILAASLLPAVRSLQQICGRIIIGLMPGLLAAQLYQLEENTPIWR